MRHVEPKVEHGWHYRAAEESAFRLEALLRQHGVTIQPGSALEEAVLTVMQVSEYKKAGTAPTSVGEFKKQYRTLIGCHELSSMILAVGEDSQFPALLPHLALLNQGQPLQNIPANGRDEAANKVFELYMGAVAMQCGTEVTLDDPSRSQGDNPDVLFTRDGKRWGIACKVLHGKSAEGFITNLKKGLSQIDASPADTGVVAFNLKNVLRHDEFWPETEDDALEGGMTLPAAWSDPATPFHLLVRQLQQVGVELESHLPANYIPQLFAGHRSVPGYLLWGATASAVIIDGRPTASSVRALNYQHAAPPDARTERVLECLNWAMYPDSDSRGVRPC